MQNHSFNAFMRVLAQERADGLSLDSYIGMARRAYRTGKMPEHVVIETLRERGASEPEISEVLDRERI